MIKNEGREGNHDYEADVLAARCRLVRRCRFSWRVDSARIRRANCSTALCQRRTTTRQISPEAPDDRPDQPAAGAKLNAGSPITLKGIAFDGGRGVKQVSVSTDGGRTWSDAKLGKDLGKYSFREWTLSVTLAGGTHDLKVKATNQAGETQPEKPQWNPAGYMRNVIETTTVTAA